MRDFVRKNPFVFVIIALLAVLAVVFASTSAKANGKDKIQICHILGNGNFELLEVPEPAVQAHIDHGDVLSTDGTCPTPPEEEPETPDEPPVEEPEEFTPVTIVKRWLLAEGSTKESAWTGGPQTVYDTESCGNGIIQVDAYVALVPEDLDVIEALDDDGLLHHGEDADITKSWSWETQTPCTAPPVEEPEPETPVVSPPSSTPPLNPEAVTGGTSESVAALPPEQRAFVEEYAQKHGIAPEDVLIEMG